MQTPPSHLTDSAPIYTQGEVRSGVLRGGARAAFKWSSRFYSDLPVDVSLSLCLGKSVCSLRAPSNVNLSTQKNCASCFPLPTAALREMRAK